MSASTEFSETPATETPHAAAGSEGVFPAEQGVSAYGTDDPSTGFAVDDAPGLLGAMTLDQPPPLPDLPSDPADAGLLMTESDPLPFTGLDDSGSVESAAVFETPVPDVSFEPPAPVATWAPASTPETDPLPPADLTADAADGLAPEAATVAPGADMSAIATDAPEEVAAGSVDPVEAYAAMPDFAMPDAGGPAEPEVAVVGAVDLAEPAEAPVEAGVSEAMSEPVTAGDPGVFAAAQPDAEPVAEEEPQAPQETEPQAVVAPSGAEPANAAPEPAFAAAPPPSEPSTAGAESVAFEPAPEPVPEPVPMAAAPVWQDAAPAAPVLAEPAPPLPVFEAPAPDLILPPAGALPVASEPPAATAPEVLPPEPAPAERPEVAAPVFAMEASASVAGLGAAVFGAVSSGFTPMGAVSAAAPEAKPVAEVKPASAPQPAAQGKPSDKAKPSEKAKPAGGAASGAEGALGVDLEALSRNIARMVEEGGKALAAYLGPRETGKTDDMADDLADALKTFGQVAEYWMADPQRSVEAQSRLYSGYLAIWANSMKKLAGEEAKPVAAPDPRDARFKDPEWSSNLFFDALKQAYLVTSNWAEQMVQGADSLDPHVKHKAEFLVKQVSNAVSPSNFLLTNPEVLRETFATSGENLVKGMQNLTEDLIEGKGDLRIRQTDMTAFEVGRNLATTPGKVIFENELMQLIQYAPATETVKKVPVLIVPPWINKFYILDLTAEKSFIRWMVENGLTVFTISWVNPDARLAAKGFDDYMRDGIMAALDAVAVATGERQAHTIGYCVGGTLLAVTLAYMAATGDDRVASSSFLTTQIDFTHAGDLKVFVDEGQLAVLERKMKDMGYLEGRKMAAAFNMLRSNDLIWPYVVNNYMKGKAPFPFDLLFWNADSTRMPAANHSYYLRNCYLENNISRGKAELSGVRIDMPKVTVPVYSVATREDHIAPPRSVFVGANLLSGPVRFVLAGSGHIAGVVNPPAKMKYQYWTDGPAGSDYDGWLAGATEHKGSWWPDWLSWFRALHPEEVPARAVGGDRLTPIEDAPGRYVRERS